MHTRASKTAKSITIAFVAILVTAALVVAGCTAANTVSSVGTTVTTVKASVPISITDAPDDQVIAASLTLNSIVLTDASGKTASILSAPYTFEATHLDAVQEPMFTPAIPEDTYTSVALQYSNAQVAYIDPTTKKIVQGTATLANTSQTITFATPIVIGNTTTTLLVDYLVANSVSISGSTVTVTPVFNVEAAPVPAQPTNGTNGLQCGIQGKVTALGTNDFTLTNPAGVALVIYVNSSTQYQGLSGFSALAVGALVEVDTQTQTDGTFLATRVEEQVPPNALAQMLVGPVTAVTGSPATSFTQVVRQNIGGSASATPIATDTITVNSATTFLLPGRFSNLSGGAPPFTPTFTASTLFAGQVVSVATTGVTGNAATAESIALSPQTVGGTIASVTAPSSSAGYTTYTLTLTTGGWLNTLTGLTSVTVYTNGNVQAINTTALAVGDTARFNGFLFNNNGALVLLADVQAPGPGNPIVPHQ